MSHTSKSTQRQPVYLSLHVERPDRRLSGDEAYAHVMLQFCARYDEGGAPRPRWPMNSRYEGEPGSERMDIGFSAQIDSRAHFGQLSYAWTVGLIGSGSNAHPIHPEVVERTAKALAKLTRAYRKAADTFGEAKTFGQFVAYTLSGLKVAGVFERSEREDAEPWRIHAPDMLAYVIDTRVQEMAVACRKVMGKSDDLATAA